MVLRHILLITPMVLALTACETAQENPNYKYSSTYGQQGTQVLAQNSRNPNPNSGQVVAAPVRYVTSSSSSSSPQIIQASTQTANGATFTRVNHECLNQERQRSVIGAGLGGTIGAIAGNKLVGGTKGTLIGAAAGGVAGYGIGDKTINCDPVVVQAPTQQAVITPAYSPGHVSSNGSLPQIFAEPVSEADYIPSPTENAFSSDTLGTPGFEAMQQSQSLDSAPLYAQTQGAGVSVPSYSQPQPRQAAPILQAATPTAQPIWQESQTEINGGYIVKAGDTVYSLSRQQCTTVSAVQSLNNIDQNFNIQVGQSLRLPVSECL